MRTHATDGARSSQIRGRRTRMQRRRSRREDGRHKLRFPPERNEGSSAVLSHRHREPTRRQEPAVHRDETEAVVRNRVTMPDLEGAAVMVPMGNRPPGKSLDPVARPVQAQAQKSIQAETETVLVIGQNVDDLGLRLSIEHYDSAEFAKRQIDPGPAQIVKRNAVAGTDASTGGAIRCPSSREGQDGPSFHPPRGLMSARTKTAMLMDTRNATISRLRLTWQPSTSPYGPVPLSLCDPRRREAGGLPPLLLADSPSALRAGWLSHRRCPSSGYHITSPPPIHACRLLSRWRALEAEVFLHDA